MRRFLADPRARDMVVNWSQIAPAALRRLRPELDRAPFDTELVELVRLAENALGGLARVQQCRLRAADDPGWGPGGGSMSCGQRGL